MNDFTIENCKSVLKAARDMNTSKSNQFNQSNSMGFSFPSPTELTTKLMQNPLYDPFGPSFGTMW